MYNNTAIIKAYNTEIDGTKSVTFFLLKLSVTIHSVALLTQYNLWTRTLHLKLFQLK